jgi:hypothetical protein
VFQEQVLKFESTCALYEHVLTPQDTRWSTVDTLSWNGKDGGSVYFLLPAAAATNTRWKVKFYRNWKDKFKVRVFCASLDAQFCAASFRLHVMVEHDPHVWMEEGAVLESGEESWWFSQLFSMHMSELPNVRPVRMRVRVQWTELEQLPYAPDLWKNCAAHFRCRWQVNNWKTGTPTTVRWRLFSEPFGQKGALWRIVVENQLSSDSDRQLVVYVKLQHLPASVN